MSLALVIAIAVPLLLLFLLVFWSPLKRAIKGVGGGRQLSSTDEPEYIDFR
jgi:hypothetical protein